MLPVVPRPPGTCEPNGTRCDKWRISRSFHFIWHHVWKAGTTSLSPYLSCNFDALPVARLLTRLGGTVPGYLHVGTAREPLGRFVSGYQEVYFRNLAGPGSRCNHRHVPWLRAALDYAEGGKLAPAGAAGRPECPIGALEAKAALRILEQFITDVSCGVRFANGEHLLSQVGRKPPGRVGAHLGVGGKYRVGPPLGVGRPPSEGRGAPGVGGKTPVSHPSPLPHTHERASRTSARSCNTQT